MLDSSLLTPPDDSPPGRPTVDARPLSVRRWSAVGLWLVIAIAVLAFTGVGIAQGQDSAADARAEREQIRQQRAAAAAELDAARAEDAQVAQALADMNATVAGQEQSLADARRQLELARLVAEEANAEVLAADAETQRIGDELGAMAVNGFVGGDRNVTNTFLESDDLTEALRQSVMLQLANTDAADLLETMRSVREDGDLARAIADNAVEQATVLEVEMAAILTELESQRALQAELKAEMERRVGEWEAQVNGFTADEERLSEFIRAEEAKAVVVVASTPSPSAAPAGTSSSGFQWPINARASSEYGWRVHPIFGTRRLHAGIDLAAGTGTPIAAAAGGTVIYSGVQGGYGNTVIIAHGNGVSTLYAHQSKIAVSNGATVSRGEVIGYVGSTGNSTGPHLHLEVRVNGGAVNPRGYLP